DEAAAALDGASRGREDGSVALRRTLRAFLLEVEDFPDDAAGIEAERVRFARARQRARRSAKEAYRDIAPPIVLEPLRDRPATDSQEAAEEHRAPAAKAPQPERRLTLLELFRSARAADPDEAPPAPRLELPAAPEPIVAQAEA